MKLLFIISGSIAAKRNIEILKFLINDKFYIDCIVTESATNTVLVNGTAGQIASLGLNDTLQSCSSPITINADNNLDTYLWNTGETTSSISVSQSGNYILEATQGGCNGDDTVYVSIVNANILAATTRNQDSVNNIYNVAVGDRTSLNELYKILQELIFKYNKISHEKLKYRDFREGDVRHSQADISKAKNLLGYNPVFKVRDGLEKTVRWHIEKNLS